MLLVSLAALGICSTAQAETKKTEVTYQVDSYYTLSIPATGEVSYMAKNFLIGTSSHNIAPDKQLVIGLSNNNDAIDQEGNISLQRKGDMEIVTTTLKKGGNILKKGDAVAAITGTNDKGTNQILVFSKMSGFEKAGTYTATLTFEAGLQNKP